MTGECPAPEAFARAVSEGAAEEMTEHVASCDACGRDWESAKRLRQLASELPFEAPEPERVLALRARVVDKAARMRRLTFARAGLYAALAVAAAAVLAISFRGPVRAPIAEEPAPRYHGSVVALNGARWSRQSAAPDEVVELVAGTIHVEVTPLGPGERFRIRAADGEVEVRGTAFDVSVEAGHMTRVAVDHGRVEVRGAGAPQAVLGAGERWRAEGHDVPPVATEPTNVAAEAPTSEPVPPASAPRRPPAPKPAPAGSVSTVAAEPPIAERSVAPSPVAPPATPSPSPQPVVPKTAPPGPEPASTDDRTREEDRRERRDERRERQDLRRWR